MTCQVIMLKKHVQHNRPEKNLKCPTCGKAFSNMGLLKRHMLIHTGTAPLSMPHCILNHIVSLNLGIDERWELSTL